MTYSIRDLKFKSNHLREIQHVFAHIGRAGSIGKMSSSSPFRTRFSDAEPMVFGAYVTCSLLGKSSPDVMDVLVDRLATEVDMPDGWSRIDPPFGMAAEHTIELGEYKLEATHMSYYDVPQVRPTVRLYTVNRKIEKWVTLANLQELGAEQVIFDGNTVHYTNLFEANIQSMLISVAREDSLTPLQLKAARGRAKALSDRLGFKGVGAFRAKKVTS